MDVPTSASQELPPQDPPIECKSTATWRRYACDGHCLQACATRSPPLQTGTWSCAALPSHAKSARPFSVGVTGTDAHGVRVLQLPRKDEPRGGATTLSPARREPYEITDGCPSPCSFNLSVQRHGVLQHHRTEAVLSEEESSGKERVARASSFSAWLCLAKSRSKAFLILSRALCLSKRAHSCFAVPHRIAS